MGIWFELSVEFGNDNDAALRFAREHRDRRIPIFDGGECVVNAGAWESSGVWWCAAHPYGEGGVGDPSNYDAKRSDDGTWIRQGISHSGPFLDEPVHSLRIADIASAFYAWLKQIETFRFALVGWEASNLDTLEWVLSDLKLNRQSELSGLVLRNDLWQQAGSPEIMIPFSETHRWIPWLG